LELEVELASENSQFSSSKMTSSRRLFFILLGRSIVQVVPPHIPPALVEASMLVLVLMLVLMLMMLTAFLALFSPASSASATSASSASPSVPMVVPSAPSPSLVVVPSVEFPMSVSSSPIVHIFRVLLLRIYHHESIVINVLLPGLEGLARLFHFILPILFFFSFPFFSLTYLLVFFTFFRIRKLVFLLVLFGLFEMLLFFRLVAKVGRLHSSSLLLLLAFLLNFRLWCLSTSTSEYLPLGVGILFHKGSDEVVQIGKGLVATVAYLGLALLEESTEILYELFSSCLPHEALRLPSIQVVKTAVQEIQRV